MYVCHSVPPLICQRTPSSHKTGRVVSRHAPRAMCLILENVIKRAYYLQQPACWHKIQQGGCGLFGWWGKPECPEENHCKLVRNWQNRVDLTKHKCRDIGLPDGMGVLNRQAAQKGMGQRELPFQVHYIIASQTDFLRSTQAPPTSEGLGFYILIVAMIWTSNFTQMEGDLQKIYQ